MAKDIVGREISVGDYVFYYNSIYKVLKVRRHTLEVILLKRSPSTKRKILISGELCLIPAEDLITSRLKGEFNG